MAVDANTSGFGKREVHKVWTERRQGARSLSVSPLRVALVVMILGTVALGAGWAGIAVIDDRTRLTLPEPVVMALGLVLEAIALAGLWAAFRAVRAAIRPSPVLRLDLSRMVLRTGRGNVVLPWEGVAVRIGALFARIDASSKGASGASPARYLVPLPLLSGGAAGLREAIRSVRPGALDGRA